MKVKPAFDRSTPEGRAALLEHQVDLVIRFLEPFEVALRDPQAAQRTAIDIGAARAAYSAVALTHDRGVARIKPEAKEFGPLGFLLFEACTLMDKRDQLTEIFAALDELRQRRDARRA
jgi:hypothetical protein